MCQNYLQASWSRWMDGWMKGRIASGDWINTAIGFHLSHESSTKTFFMSLRSLLLLFLQHPRPLSIYLEFLPRREWEWMEEGGQAGGGGGRRGKRNAWSSVQLWSAHLSVYHTVKDISTKTFRGYCSAKKKKIKRDFKMIFNNQLHIFFVLYVLR